MDAKKKKSKRPIGLLLGGLLVFLLAGTVAAAFYFKLLPGEVSQLAAEWSQKLPFVSGNDNINSANAPAEEQKQADKQVPPPDNAAAGTTTTPPAGTQNSGAQAPLATASTAIPKPDNKLDQSAKNTKKLAQVYAAMKPEEAAAVLNNMEVKTVSDILQKMEEDQAGKILAAMEAKRAAAVSQELLQYRSPANPKPN